MKQMKAHGVIALAIAVTMMWGSACGQKTQQQEAQQAETHATEATVPDEAPEPDGVQAQSDDTETVAERKIITIGAVSGNSVIEEYVIKFNANHPGYLAKLRYYEHGAQLLSSLEGDEAPDVLDLSMADAMLSEEVFTDLLPYLAADPEISPEDFHQPVWERSLVGGKMLAASAGFSWYTISARTEDVGERNTWTLQEALELLEREEDRYSQDEMLDRTGWFCQVGTPLFVDLAGRTCQFENETFYSLLQFCSAVRERAKPADENGPADPYDERFLMWFEIYESESMLNNTKQGYNGDAFCYVGFPNDRGVNESFLADAMYDSLFAVPVQTADKDAAGEFIRGVYDYDWQYRYVKAFPVLQTALEDRLAILSNEPGTAVTQDDIAYMMEMIDHTEYYRHENAHIENAVIGTVRSYLSGEKTQEETASDIQSRVSLLLSKQK